MACRSLVPTNVGRRIEKAPERSGANARSRKVAARNQSFLCLFPNIIPLFLLGMSFAKVKSSIAQIQVLWLCSRTSLRHVSAWKKNCVAVVTARFRGEGVESRVTKNYSRINTLCVLFQLNKYVEPHQSSTKLSVVPDGFLNRTAPAQIWFEKRKSHTHTTRYE